MKVTKVGLLVIIILGILSGCAQGATKQQGQVSLPGTLWNLDKMGGDVVDADITLRFDADQVSGNASCNSYFAQYTLKGDALAFGPVGSTLMACENMEAEAPYLNALSEIKTLRFDGEKLVLVDGGGKDALVFSPVQNAVLEDEGWVLTGWNTGGGISSLVIDSEITLAFEDGQASGSAGCNRYSGSYEVKGDALTFGMIASTEMACMEPEGLMEQETGYLQNLAEVAKFSIEGNDLVMMDADGNRLLMFSVVP